jgi:hypothetical protein
MTSAARAHVLPWQFDRLYAARRGALKSQDQVRSDPDEARWRFMHKWMLRRTSPSSRRVSCSCPATRVISLGLTCRTDALMAQQNNRDMTKAMREAAWTRDVYFNWPPV